MTRRPVDIIVPLLREGSDPFARCVPSIEKHTDGHRLILVVDATSAGAVGNSGRRSSSRSGSTIIFLRNERPRGFAACVNQGLASSRNEAVILDADSVVTSGWLDRMRRCAVSDPAVGAVTALSNVDGELGFARDAGRGGDPDDIERVGAAVADAGPPLYPDVTLAWPRALFVRRELLRTIGTFDEHLADPAAAVRDFGERARNAGFRTLLADDAFVCGTILGAGAIEPQARVQPAAIEAICAAIRSRRVVLAEAAKPGVLHVVHGRGGGTEKHVQELIATTRDDFRHYLLRVLPDRWRLLDTQAAPPASYDCPRQSGNAGQGWLGVLCAWLRIDAAHVHSLVDTDDDLLRLLGEAGVPYAYSIHDMYPACPTVYLIRSDGEYCDATTDAEACARCLREFDAYRGVDIRGWRERHRRFLEAARAVFAPSVWARDTLAAYYPRVHSTLAPHAMVAPEPAATRTVANGWPLPEDRCRQVAVLGAIGPEKGARVVEAMVGRIRARGLPLRLVVIGYTDRDNRSQSDDRVLTVHGHYEAAEIAALFDFYRIDLAVFPTVWPETFSYTLGETWLAGRPALVPPRGALQERVLATGAGWIMDGWPDVDALLDQLVALTAPENRAALVRRCELARRALRLGNEASDPVRKFYAAMHAETSGKPRPDASRETVHEAACRALGIEPLHVTTRAPRHAEQRPTMTASRLRRLFRG